MGYSPWGHIQSDMTDRLTHNVRLSEEPLHQAHSLNNYASTELLLPDPGLSSGHKTVSKRGVTPALTEITLYMLLLLLLLSHFSRVRLCVTPQTAAHQGSPIPGILQARTLEWVAISFSNA